MTDLDPKAPKPKTITRHTCEDCPCLETKDWSFDGENDERDSGTDATCAATGRAISNYWHADHDTPPWCPALVALPPSPAVVPSGWKLVPVEPTPEIIAAGADCYDPTWAYSDNSVSKDWARLSYKMMLAASPSPPALDGAGRDAVIEECAKVADGAAAQWRQNSDTLPEGLGGWGPMCAEEIAAAIRSIKETR